MMTSNGHHATTMARVQSLIFRYTFRTHKHVSTDHVNHGIILNAGLVAPIHSAIMRRANVTATAHLQTCHVIHGIVRDASVVVFPNATLLMVNVTATVD
ncbi:uncharacterized protein LOC125760352 isoform X2 [Rhipicephalus sanguineus]|uniref:uncharacterized protein LOC125760352 isoform X2 n=1 Tax=Rhipicephalus sanguineus TaxID=34632 RepID=UPI0020C39C08|nr:uncharacterized protein LOC125760352 isoform X2 [Rhipicephalus sanguineus]